MAIDFGTKSTVAGFINEKSTKQLIRIGKGNRGLAEKNDYENQTITEFVNIELLQEPIHYGIFDFGIWRISKKYPRYAFDIEHFGEGGNPLLVGENLLELLAQEVVEANKE